MKKPLQQYITDAVILLSTLLFVLIVGVIIIGIRSGVEVADDVNLSDAFSNVLNIIALYVTVFFVINLTSEIANSGKTVDIEKSLVIDRIKLLHDKLETIHEKVEIGTLIFQDIIRDFDRVERGHRAIVKIVSSVDSTIGVSSSDVTSHSNRFDLTLDECLNVITFTLPRNTISPSQTSYVTINNGTISITPNGIQLATIHFEALKVSLNDFLLLINRT